MWRVCLFGLTLACSHKVRTVACHMPDVMCHEWLDADPDLVEEVKGPICHDGNEHFIDGACPRANVFGVCTQGKQRTIWYRVAKHQFDDARSCTSGGGTWSATP